MIVSLHLQDDGATGARLDPGGDPALSYNTFGNPREGLRWLRELLKEMTEKRGWRKLFEGPPTFDAGASPAMPLPLIAILNLEPQHAPDTAEELGTGEGEPETVLIIRDRLLGSLSIQNCTGGAFISRTVHRDGNSLMTLPQLFRRRADAVEEFTRARRTLGKNGWREFYAGKPLRG